MPIYAYKCASCGYEKDVLQKLSDAPLTSCPECGEATFSKQLTAAGFQLKGSGWYVTDFRDGAKAKKDAAKDGAKDGAKADATADGAATTDAAKPDGAATSGSTDAGAATKPAESAAAKPAEAGPAAAKPAAGPTPSP